MFEFTVRNKESGELDFLYNSIDYEDALYHAEYEKSEWTLVSMRYCGI